MRKYLIALLVLSISAVSNSACKSSKSQTDKAVVEASSTGTADFILSFFSPGNGIDKAMLDQVVEFLKTNYPTVTYSRVRWGREGEVDLCFDLSEMTVDSKEKFKADLGEMVSTSNRVRVKENEACRTPKEK